MSAVGFVLLCLSLVILCFSNNEYVAVIVFGFMQGETLSLLGTKTCYIKTLHNHVILMNAFLSDNKYMLSIMVSYIRTYFYLITFHNVHILVRCFHIMLYCSDGVARGLSTQMLCLIIFPRNVSFR